MNRSRALDAFLEGLVDYAGLFPPAALAMPEAVERYARYSLSSDAPMLGRFVVPATRLPEFAAASLSTAVPWRLSVLAGAADVAAIAAFNLAHGDRARIDTIEAKADDTVTIAALAHAFGDAYTVYVEIAVRHDPAPLVAALAAHGLRAKIRTGAMIAEAFPASAEVLRFLTACLRAGVPFKATAGLHHPLRGEYALTYEPGSARGTMFGFLNVFLAAVLLREGTPPSELVSLLEERDADAIGVEPDALRWREWRVSSVQIAAARAAFAGSFGSCSFEEPMQDLTSLRLI